MTKRRMTIKGPDDQRLLGLLKDIISSSDANCGESLADAICTAKEVVYPRKDLLWVFDTQTNLEVFAPTKAEALQQAAEVEEESGLEFVLDYEWERYQEEYAERRRGSSAE